MTQKDSRKRTVFQICSDNAFLEVLQCPEIGTIVGKMWNGKISYNGKVDLNFRVHDCFLLLQVSRVS